MMTTLFDVLYQHPSMQSSTTLFERLDFLTRYFLGKPYILGAQGEGNEGEFDQFPLYRFDGFDCVTFVNNLLALALSHDEASFKNNLCSINYYDATPLFQNRFHFMSLDWNPQNQKKRLIDLTETIVDESNHPIADFAEGVIDKKNWFLYRTENDIRLNQPKNGEKKLIALKKLSELFEPKFVRMPYLSLEKLLENPNYFEQFPDLSVIEIVRPNWNLRDKIGTNLHVSHLGFCFRLSSGILTFRHASSDRKRVVEVPLVTYLSELRDNITIRGIHLQTLREH
ncbi:MAG: DUF1460 domain-containing protein [Coxiellaceae bacterium]|nr:DUF1460 domain-containing protein [Coxiellaceae bacterium]